MKTARAYAMFRSTAAVRWLLLLLAWTHLAYAAHQFVHAPSERSVECAACVHFDRLGDSPPPATLHVGLDVLHEVHAFYAVAAFAAPATVPYQARAP